MSPVAIFLQPCTNGSDVRRGQISRGGSSLPLNRHNAVRKDGARMLSVLDIRGLQPEAPRAATVQGGESQVPA